jgi:hypothetical protein
MQFDIEPYVGALPIRFGMTRAEVRALLGEPMSSHPNWDGTGSCDFFEDATFNVGYDRAVVVDHVGLTPRMAPVFLNGHRLWTAEQPDPNPLLLSLDSNPVEYVGFLCFPRLGITTSGFHDDDPNQCALTVFPRHRLSEWLAEAKPADTSRYANPNR